MIKSANEIRNLLEISPQNRILFTLDFNLPISQSFLFSSFLSSNYFVIANHLFDQKKICSHLIGEICDILVISADMIEKLIDFLAQNEKIVLKPLKRIILCFYF